MYLRVTHRVRTRRGILCTYGHTNENNNNNIINKLFCFRTSVSLIRLSATTQWRRRAVGMHFNALSPGELGGGARIHNARRVIVTQRAASRRTVVQPVISSSTKTRGARLPYILHAVRNPLSTNVLSKGSARVCVCTHIRAYYNII